ncbi:MAG TPA: pitrilysin family protein [Spirochaetia bacterium]|nr:pitrilysin family protein [Spirochaetales bacterium]HRW25376.1 pitrilysin family protein [Spirochaetia bacterium]
MLRDDTGIIYNRELAPGFRLLADEMPGATGVAVGLWFPVGSALERDGERGLSHFVEHMVFKGAGDRDAAELSRSIDRVGGYLNAFTERESVCLHCLVPARHAELAVDILMDMAYRPRLSAAEFEREKDVIVNEILAAEDDLEEAAQDEFFAMAYDGHPAARRIAGEAGDIREAAFSALTGFHDERFARGPVTLTVAGAVDAEALAERVLAALPPARRAAGGLAEPWDPGKPRFVRGRRMVKAEGSQVYLFTGLPIEPTIPEDDFWRLSVASMAYGESMSSRLFMRLREERGLCYGISSAFSLSKYAGLWGVSSSTTPAQLGRFSDAYLSEARSLHREGLSETEVDEALSRMRGMLELASEDPEFRMKRMARQFMYDGGAETVDATMARLGDGGAVDPGSVNRIVMDRLDPDSESVLLYGRIGARAAKTGAAAFGAELDEARGSGGGGHG